MTQPGPLESYLDELFDRLGGTGGAGRRALAETEDHMRSLAEAAVAAGAGEQEAELAAIARFGPAAQIAGQLQDVHAGIWRWVRPAFTGLWLAGGAGLVAVGVSGLVAQLLGQAYGALFVAGDAPGVTYTAARCAEYFEYAPGARSCAAAAAAHHWGEVVSGRVEIGVLGLLALLALWLGRRLTRLGTPAWTPPRLTVVLPLTAVFALAGVAATGYAGLQAATANRGMLGANLATGLAALAAAAVLAAVMLAAGTARRRRGGRPAIARR